MSQVIDLEHPANRSLLEAFGRDAAPWCEGQPRDDELEGWHLRTHPDVVERVEAIGREAVGVRVGGLLGRPCLTSHGIVVACGEGVRTLDLRVGAGAESGIAAHPFEPCPELGEDWVSVNVWLTEVPTAVGLSALRDWVSVAARRVGG